MNDELAAKAGMNITFVTTPRTTGEIMLVPGVRRPSVTEAEAKVREA